MHTSKKSVKPLKKKKGRIEVDADQITISLRDWIRNIEQTTHSVSSRVSAIEKRFTNPHYNIFSLSSDAEQLHHTDKRDESQDVIFDKTKLKENMGYQHTLLEHINESMKTNADSIDELKAMYHDITSQVHHDIDSMKNRLDSFERQKMPVVRVGRYEIPMEITGLVGGTLLLLIAVLVSLGHGSVISSPLFLVGLGIVLLLSTLVKTITYRINSRMITQHYQIPADKIPKKHLESTFSATEFEQL